MSQKQNNNNFFDINQDPYISILDQTPNSSSLLLGCLPKKSDSFFNNNNDNNQLINLNKDSMKQIIEHSNNINDQNMRIKIDKNFHSDSNKRYRQNENQMVHENINGKEKDQYQFQSKIYEDSSDKKQEKSNSNSNKTNSKKGKSNIKNYNSKSKVFYRDKFAQLTNDQNHQKQSYNYIDYAKVTRGKSPITRDQQLKRNRQSAKLSRQRKKQYVQLLEQKNAQKDRIIQELTMKIRTLEFQRDQLRDDTIAKRKNFLAQKSAAYDSLSQKLKFELTSDLQIKNSLDLMVKHYGAAGDQRIATTNIYFKEIIDILIGDIHKYIIHCAITNKGLFGVGQWDAFDTQSAEILGVKKQKRSALSSKYGQRLITQANLFKDLAQQFHNIYQSIQQQARVIENIFNDIKAQFSNRSLASLIVWLEQNKYRKQIKKLRGFWMDLVQGRNVLQNQVENNGRIRKQSKTQDD